MLINKGLSIGDVVTLKLINGDEIIARYESDDGEEIRLERPLAITMSPQGMGLIPWIFLGDAKVITLKKSHVFAMVPSKKDAATQYMQGTTGIALA
jgi:hypothetical protein